MHETTFIRNLAVASDQGLVRNCSPVYFNTEHVCDDFFSVLVNFRVNQCYIIVTSNNVAQCWESFVDSLDSYGVWQRISDCHQLHICSDHRYNETPWVSCAHSAHNLGLGEGSMHYWDVDSQLLLEGWVKVLSASRSDQTVGVCKFGKHANLTRVLKFDSRCHYLIFNYDPLFFSI